MKIIPDAKKTTLRNGLRIVTEKIETLRSISMGIAVGTGSVNEVQDVSGISHLIEHMIYPVPEIGYGGLGIHLTPTIL